jgi:hypothetical protein
MPRTPQLVTGRVEVTPFEDLTEDRYEFLGLSQAEPNLGTGNQYDVLTLGNSNVRVWSNSINVASVTATGNIQGNIGIFDDILVGNIDIGNIIGNGNLQVQSITANLFVSAVGNVIGGNVNTSGDVSAGGNVTGGNINTGGNISATGNITAANFSSSGNVSLGNLTVANTTISTVLVDGNITLDPTGNGLVVIDTVTGLVVPVGNIAQRPIAPPAGTLRFNDEFLRLEVYDGAAWADITANVTNQVLNGDGSTVQFILDRNSTSAAALIMLNGVVQLPAVAYNITGNTLIFSQAPESTDVIDVRFL